MNRTPAQLKFPLKDPYSNSTDGIFEEHEPPDGIRLNDNRLYEWEYRELIVNEKDWSRVSLLNLSSRL